LALTSWVESLRPPAKHESKETKGRKSAKAKKTPVIETKALDQVKTHENEEKGSIEDELVPFESQSEVVKSA
jgi:hypothetical protein